MENESKPFWQSKTMIANAVALIAAVVTTLGVEVQAAEQAAIAGGVLAVLNIVLRAMTSTAVRAKK